MRFESALAANLALTLTVAGALIVAQELGRRRDLVDALTPLIHEYGQPSTNPARCIQLIRYMKREMERILGENWELPEEYRKQIEALAR